MARAIGNITAYQLKYGVDPKPEYTLTFSNLYGGLNIKNLEYLLNSNESPDMLNMNWNNGILSSRAGQVWAIPEMLGYGHACSSEKYYGRVFFHIGDRSTRKGGGIYYCDPEASNPVVVKLYSLPQAVFKRGTFFRYQDDLFYKAPGLFLKISYDGEADTFSAAPVEPYTPVILINTDPETCAGDDYQVENRISPCKEVWYNAKAGVKTYKLPVQNIDNVVSVIVDGNGIPHPDDGGLAYTIDRVNGAITFATAPEVTEPPTNNTVRIVYSKFNRDAERSIMDCPYAAVYGGNDNVCIVLGGCEAQPNAYFWSNNDNLSMNPGYFPMTNYNLAGDNSEMITGFGKQQNLLVIFKEGSVGKAEFSLTEIDGKQYISMDYKNINSRIGCDLPWTIQLVENNLVFCNTEQGVHIVLNSSAALENNIQCVSEKINGAPGRDGLLHAVREGLKYGGCVCAVDNETKYLLTVLGPIEYAKPAWDVTYEWNYTISGYNNPSWFRHNNIRAVSYFQGPGFLGYLTPNGQVVMRAEQFFADCVTKDGLAHAGEYEPINKRYVFPAMFYDTYDRMKNVNSIVFSVRGDTNSHAHITYRCDYMEREDPTDIVAKGGWQLVPRNLKEWSLRVFGFAQVFRRKPGFKHIRHFSMKLEDNTLGHDMSIVSAQVFYNYQGRQK